MFVKCSAIYMAITRLILEVELCCGKDKESTTNDCLIFLKKKNIASQIN